MSEPFPDPALPAKTDARASWLAGVDTAGGGRLPDAWDPSGLASAYQVAALLARSQVVPRALIGKPEDIFVVLWTGKELGLSAMTALRHLPVVHGRATMSAELMRARAMAHPECRYFDVIEADAEHAVVEWQRGDRPAQRANFTTEDARRAGLIRDDSGWKKYPEDLCVARATARGVRRGFPEVLGPASYTPEEAREAIDLEQGEGGRYSAPSEAAQRAAETILLQRNAPRAAPAAAAVDDPQTGIAVTLDPAIVDSLRRRPVESAGGTAAVTELPYQPQPLANPAGIRGDEPIPLEQLQAAGLVDDPRPLPGSSTVIPKAWQPVLDLGLPRVGDKIAQRLLEAGLGTYEAIVEAGAARIASKVAGVSPEGAQAIVFFAEGRLHPEPEPSSAAGADHQADMAAAAKTASPPPNAGHQPPAADDSRFAEGGDEGYESLAPAPVAPPAAEPQVGIPFPGQQAKPPDRWAAPKYDPPPPTAAEMQPISRAEAFAIERHAVRTKRSGAPSGHEGDRVAKASLLRFVEDTFGVPLDRLPKYFYRAAFRWAESDGINPQVEEIAVLRERGRIPIGPPRR